MNTVLMYVIRCLVSRFKAPGGRFRNLKFDLLYKCIYLIQQRLLRQLVIGNWALAIWAYRTQCNALLE